MTSKLYVQKRGPSGGAHVDYSAFTGRKGAPFFDENNTATILMGMRCYQAQAGNGQFKIMDPAGELARSDFDFNLPAHALVTWTEDDPGAEIWLARHRIGAADGGRGIIKVDNEVDFDVLTEDCNVELRGQAFAEHWVRPAETDVQRLVALQLYTLNGSSSTATYHRDTCEVTINTGHLTPNTNTVSMPAKKYPPGTQPEEVVRDCADTAGKTYGVVIHHTGGSHLCLFYTIDSDHSTYASDISISDHDDEWDPDHPTDPVFEPHWESGKASLYDGQSLLSGMVGLYGTEQATYVTYATNETSYDYWVDVYNDTVSTTSGQAATRTAGILENRRLTHVTHRVSIIMNSDQVDMVAAGMSLQIKAVAALGGSYLNTYQTRRIAECTFESRIDGTYWAHLNLDRPPLRVAPGKGHVGPIPPVQSEPGGGVISDYLWTFTDNNNDTTNTYPVGNEAASQWHPGYIHSHVIQPGVSNHSEVTKPPISPGTYHFRIVMRRGSTTYNGGGITATVKSWDGGVDSLIWTSSAVTAIVDTTVEDDITFPAGADYFTFGVDYNDSYIAEAELTHGSATASFEGTAPPPASTDGTGAIGTSPIYAPADHQHPWQEAENTPIDDEGGYYAGQNVEEALQELGATAGDAPAEHDLPHGYTLTKQGVIIERGTTGTWKEALVESPNIFWDPQAGHYKMVFVGYTGTPASPTEGAIGYAYAESPDGPWTEFGSNPFFSKSGAGVDSSGVSGPLVWYADGTYHLFYIGLTASGYEQGTKRLCHATSTDFITWSRLGAIIEPFGTGWREDAIWHPNIVKRGGVYYLFFNATGDVSAVTTERIGYATSPDLNTWTVDDTNSPVLSEGSGGDWDDELVGDPAVYRIGETWYMAYYGYDGANSRDGIAYTSDADFPLGWAKFAGNPILDIGTAGAYDEDAAHKPAIWLTATRIYHFYTAVSESFLKREIGLATEDAPVAVPSEEDLQNAGHWETIVSGSSPPVAVTNEASTDWLVGWVPPS